MPMQPNQSSSIQATQAAMQQATAQPEQEQGIPAQQEATEQPSQENTGQDNFDTQILENLEQHLNQINPKQKQFLASALQHYANIVIPTLGIVCGQEVFDYFLNIYKQNFAKGTGSSPVQQQQANSAPTPVQGQQPNQVPQPQAQAPQQQAPVQQPPQQ